LFHSSPLKLLQCHVTGTLLLLLLLQTRSADPGCRPMVLQTLDAAQALGFTVVRIWAFNDGPGWMSLQPQAGEGSSHDTLATMAGAVNLQRSRP
jgi:hypothetical protein